MQTVLTAILPVLGVIIGASLQYFFSKSGEKRKQLETLRNQAYVDYLRAVAQLAKLGKSDSAKRSELLVAAADAKTRICVYGAGSVVMALAAFERGSLVLDSPDSKARFLDICSEMRRQSLGKDEVIASDNFSLVLFGAHNND